jgi:hypothetical protein
MKIGGIIKHILYLGIIDVFLRSLAKPVVLNVIKGKSTVTRNLVKPPNGITFNNPQLKPVLTSVYSVIAGFPNKGSVTI